MEQKKQVLSQCYHCGNKGLLNIVATHSQEYGGIIIDDFGIQIDSELREYMHWYILSCPVCKRVTLYELYANEAYADQEGNLHYEKEIIYPSNKLNYEGVPEHIKSAFEAALKVKGIDTDICLLSLRRALEAICKDKQAEGKNLDAMIKDLVDKNIFPLTFDDACWIIRQLGNKAAHADKTIFYIQEVDQVTEFLEVIINYLYCLPQNIQKLKKKIEDKKTSSM